MQIEFILVFLIFGLS